MSADVPKLSHQTNQILEAKYQVNFVFTFITFNEPPNNIPLTATSVPIGLS